MCVCVFMYIFIYIYLYLYTYIYIYLKQNSFHIHPSSRVLYPLISYESSHFFFISFLINHSSLSTHFPSLTHSHLFHLYSFHMNHPLDFFHTFPSGQNNRRLKSCTKVLASGVSLIWHNAEAAAYARVYLSRDSFMRDVTHSHGLSLISRTVESAAYAREFVWCDSFMWETWLIRTVRYWYNGT